MFAIVEIGGNQFTVKVGDIIEVDNQNTEVGSIMEVQPLLVLDEDGSTVKVGTPVVEGGKVSLKVIEDFRGEKIRVFKMKSKKRYARTFGFRPDQTKLEVTAIA
ncbi:50S ribosomal protein L21 [Candidatus Gracilibacteria bacterium CG2_30_37_12]|nr:MAG: 50S ribosomal protein L21 [Candidatus Gracilibacteria bacterium CG2_30_37_12]